VHPSDFDDPFSASTLSSAAPALAAAGGRVAVAAVCAADALYAFAFPFLSGFADGPVFGARIAADAAAFVVVAAVVVAEFGTAADDEFAGAFASAALASVLLMARRSAHVSTGTELMLAA